MTHIVKAGYVTVTTTVGAGRAAIDIPRGEHVPGDVPAEEIERLLVDGHIELVEAPVEAPSEPAPPAPARRPRKRATKTAG